MQECTANLGTLSILVFCKTSLPNTVKCYSCVLLWPLTGKTTTSADLPGTVVGGRRNTLELGYHDVIETGAYVVVGSIFL